MSVLRKLAVWVKYNLPWHVRHIWRLSLPDQSSSHLSNIRIYELNRAIRFFPGTPCLVLEIGGGAGWQARAIEEHGFRVISVDLTSCPYTASRIFPVMNYDGHNLPFPPASFDAIFSSNVLEHIPHVREFQTEIKRVLKPGGIAIHVLPSASWRIWTMMTFYLRHGHNIRLFTVRINRERRHGERGTLLGEVVLFSRFAWSRLFRETGWQILHRDVNRLFYTGYSVCDSRLGFIFRKVISFVLGSSCHIYCLRSIR